MKRESPDSTRPHLPVMAREVLDRLAPSPGGVWVDATVGYGGHAEKIAERMGPNGLLLGLDVDPEAVRFCRERSPEWGAPVRIVRAGYDNLSEVLHGLGVEGIRGFFADLGVSSPQLDVAERGFSFKREGPLDMRMDPDAPISAARWLAEVSERDLRFVLRRFGEEKRARSVARAIVKARDRGSIESTRDLAEAVSSCFPDRDRAGGIHPATRTFQALRIAVNHEIDRLRRLLAVLPGLLEPGACAVFLAYHGLEDGEIKRAFARWSAADPELRRLPVRGRLEGWMTPLASKPVRPSGEEIERNPRARSARLRAARRSALPWSRGPGDRIRDEADGDVEP